MPAEKDYQIIVEATREMLETRVKAQLDDGWECAGGCQLDTRGHPNSPWQRWVQAMTKTSGGE